MDTLAYMSVRMVPRSSYPVRFALALYRLNLCLTAKPVPDPLTPPEGKEGLAIIGDVCSKRPATARTYCLCRRGTIQVGASVRVTMVECKESVGRHGHVTILSYRYCWAFTLLHSTYQVPVIFSRAWCILAMVDLSGFP